MYTQIEKVMMAIIFDCTHFHEYIYGMSQMKETSQTTENDTQETTSSNTSQTSKNGHVCAEIPYYIVSSIVQKKCW